VSESILEKALLEAEQLEDTMKSNAKEILSSTMKKEIHELVKESLNEDDYIKEQEEEEEVDVMDIEDEIDGEEPDMELDLLDDIELDIEDETDDVELPELPPLDLTLASDEEVLKVFKAMGDEDGIIIQKDDNEIELTDTTTDTEYIIKLEEQKKSKKMKRVNETNEVSEMDDMDEMDNMDLGEVVYEIELDEDFDESGVLGVDSPESEEAEADYDKELGEDQEYGGNKGDESRSKRDYTEDKEYGGNKGDESRSKRDYTEASRTLGFGRDSGGKHKPSGIRKAITSNRNLGESRIRKSYNLLKEEVETLKVKNSDYRKALTTFRDKLNEVGVFNSNLAYVTRLFTEHSTTKHEKINILKRFDGVNTLKGSKGLYKVIKESLSQKVVKKTKTISESVQKITKTPTSGGKLLESKVYENPQFSRMKDLMSKL